MSILDALAPYKIAAEIAVFGALAGCVMFGVHEFLEHEQDIGYRKATTEYAAKLAEAKDAALQRERDLTAQRDAAISKGSERDKTIELLGAANASVVTGLRGTTDALARSVSLPGATVDSLGKSVTALSTVFTECVGRYTELAKKADRHANDVQVMTDAWPTSQAKKGDQ